MRKVPEDVRSGTERWGWWLQATGLGILVLGALGIGSIALLDLFDAPGVLYGMALASPLGIVLGLVGGALLAVGQARRLRAGGSDSPSERGP